MLCHLGNRLGKVVHPLTIQMMGIELGVVIEHDNVLLNPQTWREDKGLVARPARAQHATCGLERLHIVKALRATVGAIKDRILQFGHRGAPLALPHTLQRVVQPHRKGLGEEIAQKLGIEWPESNDVVVVPRHGPVGIVVRVKDKERLGAVELVHRRQIQALDRQFSLALQGMVDHQHVEKQYR